MIDPEIDAIIAQLTALEADDKQDTNQDNLVDIDTLQRDLSQMTLVPVDRIRWPSGPYYPGDNEPALSLLTHDDTEINLDKDTSQLVRLLVNTPRFQESLKDETFVSNFVEDVERFSGTDLSEVLPKVDWAALIDEVKAEPQVAYELVSEEHSVIYVDGRPYRQRRFSLPLPNINPDGTIIFPIRPSDVTFNKNDVESPWLVRWTNPNTNEVNYLWFTLDEPIEQEQQEQQYVNEQRPDSNADADADSDSDSDSNLSFDSDDGLSGGSDSEDSDTNVKRRGPALDNFEEDDFMTEEIDASINLKALNNNERLLPLNMLTSDDHQTKILERAHKTNGRLVKDLARVFDVNLLRFYNELAEKDPMAPYFKNYIDQRA